MARKFSLQAGMRFDLRTGKWGWPIPSEPRPFFEFLKAHPGHPFGNVVSAPSDPYIWIAPNSEIGQEIVFERLTPEEYRLIAPSAFADDGKIDEDSLVLGPGPMIGFTALSATAHKLRDGEMGLILSPGVVKNAKGDLELEDPISTGELRSALLLWDHLDWPEVSLFPRKLPPDAAFLQQEGILSRSNHISQGVLHSKRDLLSVADTVFECSNVEQPGRWQVGHGLGGSLGDDEEDRRGIVIDLADIASVPDRSVPLEDVLAFREKRRAEMIALRTHLFDLYQRILAAPDGIVAMIQESDRLRAAVEAQHRVSKESGLKTVVGNLGATVKFGIGAAALAAGRAFETNSKLSAVIGAGIGAFTVSAAISRAKATHEKRELDYLISIERELKCPK